MKKPLDFPQFTVKEIRPKDDKFLILGSFNQTKVTLEERYWLIKNDECYIGDLCELDLNEKTGIFIFYHQEQAEQIRPTETYSCITNHWNWNFMEVILNPETSWVHETFQPKDAQVFYLANGLRGWCEYGKKIDKDATIGDVIKNGWDHEECEICDARIGQGGSPECYKNKWFWLCVNCFNKYALNRDLSFTDDLLH